MICRLLSLILVCACLLASMTAQEAPDADKKARHNIVIFVADGLRHGSVNPTDTPTLWRVRQSGVHFTNSHSLFPTFTTANASAIATGHYLGDTGDFSNVIWTKYLLFTNNNFARTEGSSATPFLEDDQVIGDLNDHLHGSYLQEGTLFQAARKAGYRTVSVGKLGPAAILDVEALTPQDHEFVVPGSDPNGVPYDVLLDDLTGRFNPKSHNAAPPLPPMIADAFANDKASAVSPDRSNGCSKEKDKEDACGNGSAHTTAANWGQQQYMVDAVTREILPTLKKSNQPFLLVFWSRDPDGTQHNQGDSIGSLTPGINGSTSRKALQNCDDDLRQIIEYLHDNGLENSTDVIVTSDHGFATISRGAMNAPKPGTGQQAPLKDTLPYGFLAIDLAQQLKLYLFDPDLPEPGSSSGNSFQQVDIQGGKLPKRGNALLGTAVHSADGSDAKVIVAANGGSDLIYVPNDDKDMVRSIIEFLATRDYVGGLFVNEDTVGKFKGALPMRAINLVGKTVLPTPTIVVTFKVFYLKPGDLQSAVQVSDTFLKTGQGMHGGFGRDSTFNNMAALGPDFRPGPDPVPVSNADIAPTVAKIIGAELVSVGPLQGRVMEEALARPGRKIAFKRLVLRSEPEPLTGRRTILEYQKADGRLYFDRACFVPGTKLNCD
jgi:predicted AlkP superfamily pyrophosphatase or phosphodiesterase